MADSELGELRRPPRTLEQRLERANRWRSQGMAAGTNDVLYPGTPDSAVFAAGGSAAEAATTGAAAPQWFGEVFALTTASTGIELLTYYPYAWSEVVSLNGIRLDPGVDYTIVGRTLTLTDVADALLGIGADTWTLAVNYAYFDTADQTPIAGLAFGGLESTGSLTLPATPAAGSVAVLITSGEVTGVSGAFTTWTKLYDDATGMDGVSTEISLWVGENPSSGTTVTLTGTFTWGMYCAGVLIDDVGGALSLRSSAIANHHDILGVQATPTVTAVVGDIVVAGSLNKHDFLSQRFPSTTASWSETGYTGVRADYSGSTTKRGTGVDAGIATATTVGAEFYIDGGATGYTQFGMFALEVT